MIGKETDGKRNGRGQETRERHRGKGVRVTENEEEGVRRRKEDKGKKRKEGRGTKRRQKGQMNMVRMEKRCNEIMTKGILREKIKETN